MLDPLALIVPVRLMSPLTSRSNPGELVLIPTSFEAASTYKTFVSTVKLPENVPVVPLKLPVVNVVALTVPPVIVAVPSVIVDPSIVAEDNILPVTSRGCVGILLIPTLSLTESTNKTFVSNTVLEENAAIPVTSSVSDIVTPPSVATTNASLTLIPPSSDESADTSRVLTVLIAPVAPTVKLAAFTSMPPSSEDKPSTVNVLDVSTAPAADTVNAAALTSIPPSSEDKPTTVSVPSEMILPSALMLPTMSISTPVAP